MIKKMILEKRLVRLLLNVAVLVGVSVALVDRGQAYFGPTPSSPLDSVTPVPNRAVNVNSVTTAHIFGIPEDENQSTILTRTSLNLVVTGLMASDGTNSLALISANGQPEAAFATGQEILPGVQLRSVEHDRVVIARNGALETVPLKELAEVGSVAQPMILAHNDTAAIETPATLSPWVGNRGIRVASNATGVQPNDAAPSAAPAGPGQPPTNGGNRKGKRSDSKPNQSTGNAAGPPGPSSGSPNIEVPRPAAGASTPQVPRPAPGTPIPEVPRAPAGAPLDGPPRPSS